MLNKISTRLSFVVLTALIISGFPNFMVQEAFAIAPSITAVTGDDTSGNSAATKKIIVSFGPNVYVNTGSGDTVASWTLSDNLTVASVTAIEFGLSCGGGTATMTITTNEDIPTGLKPTVTYAVGTVILSCLDDSLLFGGNDVAQDGLRPTVLSVTTTSTTTIDVVFSEDVTGVIVDDFVVTSPAAAVTGVSVSGSTVTLTTAAFGEDDTPTVTIQNTGVQDTDGDFVNTLNSGATVATDGIATDTPRKNGSGCDGDCEAPTLGINSKNMRIVENGFTYNGHSVNVEKFFTPYPLITANVGKQNTAVFKIYENMGPENVKHFTFAFGLDKNDIISNSKAMIELDIDHEGTETVTITDPENALDNIKVSTNIENCNGDDSDTQCLIVTIDHRFRAPLDFNIVATDVWDMKRNSWQNYFNHGIEVTGESLNPAKIHDGINAGIIYHLTETSKGTALDEFGNSWTFQYGKWMKDYIQNEPIQDTSSVFNRMHSDFAEYKELQAQKAIEQLLELCPTCLDSFTDFDDPFSYESFSKK